MEQEDETMKRLRDIPNLRQRVLHVLEIYEYDISTKRKANNRFQYAFWKIKHYIDKYDYNIDPPIEGGDVLDWAICNINWENGKF